MGHSKTISQPFIVALMTDLLDVQENDTVLEVGTGLGYHAAILASLAERIYSIEIIEELAAVARRKLGTLGFSSVELKVGNGEFGWPEHAPFDRIRMRRFRTGAARCCTSLSVAGAWWCPPASPRRRC
ncbi:MAG: rRNA adenine N-6-methyltransferase family protein [Rhodospirillales bacterium]